MGIADDRLHDNVGAYLGVRIPEEMDRDLTELGNALVGDTRRLRSGKCYAARLGLALGLEVLRTPAWIAEMRRLRMMAGAR